MSEFIWTEKCDLGQCIFNVGGECVAKADKREKCHYRQLKMNGESCKKEQQKPNRPKIIACDFDGTLCEDKYPEIGAPRRDVFRYLKKQKAEGAKLILWTCRVGARLTEAVRWCCDHELIFDAVNVNLPGIIELYGSDTRKIFADEYIDDKNCSEEFMFTDEKSDDKEPVHENIKTIEQVRAENPFATVMFVNDFIMNAQDGYITDHDGYGYFHDGIEETGDPARANAIGRFYACSYRKKYPYVCWYNR